MHAQRWPSEEPRTRTLLPVALLGLLLLGMTGCATATTGRTHLLERSAAYVTYRLPAEQVLEVAREILKERGYVIIESTDPLYVRTAWRVKFDDTLDIGALRERQFVMGKQLDDGRFVVNAYRFSYTTVGRTAPHPSSPEKDESGGYKRMVKGDPLSYAPPVLTRDLELEWQILSRVSPSVARELESQVDQYLATGSK
ncbi:hypothetical protein JRI60_25560 [Archangium violaceum]|uniref:hypothetical protein n=1 Tax=Archangium violaceum TaxID=83451 RepID=UPI0019521B3C|nr:hypothetical protein [Archangium violaceum]QRO02138.1 hypothetical protein JRI60_25560 [Archangium violaceum]